MKPSVVLLALSLAANGIGLAVFAFSPARSATSGKAPSVNEANAPRSQSRGSETNAGTVAASGAAAEPAADLAALLRSDDPAALCAALRAAGVPEDAVRAIVREKINARYLARIRALEAGVDGADRPYWQPSARRSLTAEQRAERRRLQREMMDETNKLLGPRETARGGSDRYNFLPEEKRAQLAQVESDYREMMSDLQRGMEEFPLKSEQEAMRMLAEEQKRDIDALLTPKEREAVELHTSRAANIVRDQYGAVLTSEDEFKQIYQLQRDYLDRFGGRPGGAPGDAAARAEAMKALQSQINEILGPERVAAVARLRDPDVRMLQAAADRLNLPEAAITETTLALREQAAQESQRIANDPSLDAAARRQAMSALAGQVRAQLHNVLGADGGDTFADRAGWISALSRGNAFTVRPEGGVQITREVRARTLPAPARAP